MPTTSPLTVRSSLSYPRPSLTTTSRSGTCFLRYLAWAAPNRETLNEPVKVKGVAVKDTSGFVENLMALASAGHKLEDRSKLLELNKARVAFKHYGILPASGEAVKFQTYAEDSFEAACATCSM